MHVQICKFVVLMYCIIVLHAFVCFLLMNHLCRFINHLKKGHPQFSYLSLRANYSSLSLSFNRTGNVRVNTAVILMLVMINKDSLLWLDGLLWWSEFNIGFFLFLVGSINDFSVIDLRVF